MKKTLCFFWLEIHEHCKNLLTCQKSSLKYFSAYVVVSNLGLECPNFRYPYYYFSKEEVEVARRRQIFNFFTVYNPANFSTTLLVCKQYIQQVRTDEYVIQNTYLVLRDKGKNKNIGYLLIR